MEPKIKNFLEQVNRASGGKLAEEFPDPYAGFVFIGGPTQEHPDAGYLVVHCPIEDADEWEALFREEPPPVEPSEPEAPKVKPPATRRCFHRV